MKFIWQSFILILSFLLVFIWQQTELSQYTIQTLGFLIFLYLIIYIRGKKLSFANDRLSVFILQSAILLIIFATGGLSSMFFFLLYFLCFGIGLVFEPAAVFVFTLSAIAIFLPDISKDDTTANVIKIASLVLISPLGFFFGREYQKVEENDERIETMENTSKQAADAIARDVEDVLDREKNVLKEEDVEKLNDILEETEVLREETQK